MSKRKQARKTAIEKISDHILENGLGDTSLRTLAKAASVSDRMLLYYFDNKAEILETSLTYLSLQLANKLDAAIPGYKTHSKSELFGAAAILTTSAELRPYMRLGVEINAAAGRDNVLFLPIAQSIADGFFEWILERLDPSGLADPQTDAALIFTMIDGLAMLDVCTDKVTYLKTAKAMEKALQT